MTRVSHECVINWCIVGAESVNVVQRVCPYWVLQVQCICSVPQAWLVPLHYVRNHNFGFFVRRVHIPVALSHHVHVRLQICWPIGHPCKGGCWDVIDCECVNVSFCHARQAIGSADAGRCQMLCNHRHSFVTIVSVFCLFVLACICV